MTDHEDGENLKQMVELEGCLPLKPSYQRGEMSLDSTWHRNLTLNSWQATKIAVVLVGEIG